MIAGRNRAGWWGVAAALALAGGAAAQTQPGATPRPAAPAAIAANPATPEARARLSEIKVQLAWLADPVLSACPLKAAAQRQTMLEVSGRVPSAELHARAAEMARIASDLAILDALTVARMSLPRPAAVPTARLNLECSNVLMEPGFTSLKDLEVQATADGQVILHGTAPSYEMKLLASQRVRRVPGCTCVVNRMTVQPRIVNGNSVSAVTADGRLTVAAPPVSQPVTAPVTGAAKPLAPAAKPATPTLALVSAAMPAKNSAPTRVDPAVTRAVFEARKDPAFVVKPVTPSQPAKDQGPSTARVAEVRPVAHQAPAPPAEPGKVDAATSQTASDLPATPAICKAPTAPEIPCTVARPAQAEAPSPTDSKAPEATPAPAISCKPEAPRSAAQEQEHPAAAEAPAPGSLADWYRRRIARECGLEVECVGVCFPAPSDMAVTLCLAERSLAGRLCTKVSRIPELAPYHVKIEVQGPAPR